MISKVKGKAKHFVPRSEGADDVCFCSSFHSTFVFGSCGETQNQTSICCLRPEPSQMFELRFSASLETSELEPWERMLRRSAEKL